MLIILTIMALLGFTILKIVFVTLRAHTLGYQINYTTTIDFLDYLLAHEFTHLIDIPNRLNAISNDNCAREFFFGDGMAANCGMETNSFSQFSWTGTRSPLKLNYFYLCPYLEKYYGGKKIESQNVFDFMSAVYEKIDFISIYQFTDPFEDLAELTAFCSLTKSNPLGKIRTAYFNSQWRDDVLGFHK